MRIRIQEDSHNDIQIHITVSNYTYLQVASLLEAVLLCSCEEAVEAVGPVAQPPVCHNDQRHRDIRSPLLLQYTLIER